MTPKRTRVLAPIQWDAYRPLRELVFEAIREAIISGKLKPGERLMEIQISEDLGVSRTPVREAIRKLELEGFVVMVPRKGAYVAELSLRDMAEVFEIRSALEGLAAELAAERITDDGIDQMQRLLAQTAENTAQNNLKGWIAADTDFHDIIYKASRNGRLVQIIANLREQIQIFRTTSLGHPGRLPTALDEHRQIADAISQRNGRLARKLAQTHIENAEKVFIDEYKAKERRQEHKQDE